MFSSTVFEYFFSLNDIRHSYISLWLQCDIHEYLLNIQLQFSRNTTKTLHKSFFIISKFHFEISRYYYESEFRLKCKLFAFYFFISNLWKRDFPILFYFDFFFLFNFGPSSNKQTQLHQPCNLVDYNVAKYSLSSYLVTYASCNVSSILVEKLFVILWSYICHNQIKAQKPNKLFYKIESITKSWFSSIKYIYYSQKKKQSYYEIDCYFNVICENVCLAVLL